MTDQQERLQRWIDASHLTTDIDPFMIVTIQGLGRFDFYLNSDDLQVLQNHGTPFDIDRVKHLTDTVTLSYFWVLAAYEAVRTILQRIKAQPSNYTDTGIKTFSNLDREFRRIRVPLAKFDPPESIRIRILKLLFRYWCQIRELRGR